MARPPPSRAHDHDCLRLPPASSPQNSEAGKKESTVHRLNQLSPPCATPFSKSSLDHRRSAARVVKNGFAANSGVSESAKVVLVRISRRGHLKRERAVAVDGFLHQAGGFGLLDEFAHVGEPSGMALRNDHAIEIRPVV